MSRSLNRCEFIGNLTRDPLSHYTQSGAVNSRFSIAINKVIKKQDGTTEESTDYFDVVAWGPLAEICNKILKKGSYVYVSGELRNESWNDKEGNKRVKTVLRANEMIILTSKKDGPVETTSTSAATEGEDAPVVIEEISEDEEMPF